LKALVVFWLLGRVVNTVDRIYRLTWTLSLASVPLAVEGLRNFRAGAFLENSAGRIVGYGAGLAGNPNDLALTLDLILPLSLALLLSARSFWGRCAAGVSALVSVACVVVTFSRGGFLALAAILLLAIFWAIRRRLAWVIPAAVIGLVIVPPLLPGGYIDRLATLTNIDADPTHSAQDRMRDTLTAAHLIGEHPLIGAGLGNDILALNQARGATWRSVHDVYLQYGVDLGLIGAGLFVALLVTSIRGARRSERRAERRDLDDRVTAIAGGVRISLIAFAVAAFSYPVAYYFYFYYFAGLAVALRSITGSRES
jgi:O-antigen ligase